MTFDKRHGGPYDRGSADRYYGRAFNPHYYVKGTKTSTLVQEADMTQEEVEAYTAGWDEETSRKEWR